MHDGTGKMADSLKTAFQYFTNGNSSTKYRGNEVLQFSLETIENHAYKLGLIHEQLRLVMDIIGKGRFSDTVNMRLVKALIPNDTVPQFIVLKAVFIISKGHLSQNVQTVLVKWIVFIYNMIDDYDQLNAIYGIIFQFLQNSALSPHICHLLYLMTKKEHVILCRVKQILALQQKIPGPKPHLMGLLSIYKLYCPHLVAVNLPTGRKNYFPQADRRWAAALRLVQTRTAVKRQLSPSQIELPQAKRAKYDIIPDVHVINTDTDTTRGYLKIAMKKLPISTVQSFDQFAKNFDIIEPPSQMCSVLKSKNLKYMMSVKPDRVQIARFNNWMGFTLYEELLKSPNSGSTPQGLDLLEKLMQFAEHVEEGIPVVDSFIAQYLLRWNGFDYRNHILQLITRIRLYKMKDLQFILEPLKQLFIHSPLHVKCQILVCLTDLIRNYVLVELPRFLDAMELQQRFLMMMPEDDTTQFKHSIFIDDIQQIDLTAMLWKLIEFVQNICVLGLQMENDHALLMSYVLSFSELVVDLHLQHSIPFVVIPHVSIVYHILFSQNLNAISRLGAIMSSYINAFDSLRFNIVRSPSVQRSLQQVPLFNLLILDMSDALWRHRMFSKTAHADSVYSEAKDKLSIPQTYQLLSLFEHPAFIGFALEFIEKLPRDEKPKELHLLKPNMERYLEHLAENGISGVTKFMNSFKKKKKQSLS